MSASTLADQFSTDDPEGQAKLAVTVIVAVIAFCLLYAAIQVFCVSYGEKACNPSTVTIYVGAVRCLLASFTA